MLILHRKFIEIFQIVLYEIGRIFYIFPELPQNPNHGIYSLMFSNVILLRDFCKKLSFIGLLLGITLI